MATSPKGFYRALAPITTAMATLTVPAGKRWVVTNVVASNATAAAVAVTVQLDGVALVPAQSVPASGTVSLTCTQVVEAGGTVKVGAATAAAVGVHISGVEMDL